MRRPGVSQQDKARVEQVIATTGESLWVEQEAQLDAVTALSGSGPAYVFFFLEAMTQAGIEMGLSREQAYRLAVGTFAGASELARASDDPPEVLRQRVTSKGRHHPRGDHFDGTGPGPGAVHQGPARGARSGPRNWATSSAARRLSAPATERVAGHDAGKHREAQPVVEAEGLEAAFAFAARGSARSARPPAPRPRPS